MIQEKDFLYRVPVKTAPITTPGGQIRNPEILVDLEGGEFMHGNILDANSTNKLVNQSVKEAVDNKLNESGYVTKDLLEAETTRATEQENSLKTLIDAETSARTKGDEYLSSKIKAEQTRAEGKEKEISDKLAIVSSGANKYTLPVASAIALGGIKVATNKNGTQWPICVNDNGVACTCIDGLSQGYGNSIDSLLVMDDDDHSAKYGWGGIDIGSSDGVKTHVYFPQASGTFALTSDCGLLVMNDGIVNNNIGFDGYKQNVLISASGNYNISNWYNSSPVGSVMDIYPYSDINGTITADNKYIFQTMGTSSSGLPIIVTKKSINLSSSHYIRLIHISDGVYVCVSILGY